MARGLTTGAVKAAVGSAGRNITTLQADAPVLAVEGQGTSCDTAIATEAAAALLREQGGLDEPDVATVLSSGVELQAEVGVANYKRNSSQECFCIISTLYEPG
jgi:hypothetical protein